MVESYCYDRNCFAGLTEWKEAYVKYLQGAYRKGEDKYNGIYLYQDPDEKRSYMLVYYKKLAAFLNQREKEFFKENLIDDEKFVYEADIYEDKGVLIRVESKDEKELFYMQSDQFGFSAPKGSAVKKEKDMRIYDVYLKLSKDKNKEENVARWIWESRTIGGSFLWSLEKWENRNPAYNKTRGNYYLQDRCDLTLAEIRGCYEVEADARTIGKEKNNFLYNKVKKAENENLRRWLNHFGSFEKYIEYFCMEDFVESVDEKENNRKCPINLYDLTGENIIGKKYIEENIYEYRDKDIYKSDDVEKYCKNLEDMFDGLCSRIVERANRMEQDISDIE